MDAKLFSVKHDFILLYAKNLKDGIIKKNIVNDIPAHYDKVDADGKRYYLKPLRYMGTADAREDRPNLYFGIKDRNGNEIFPIRTDGSDGRWRWSKDKVEKEYDKLVFLEGRNGTTVQYKIYAEDSTEVPNETIWYNSEVGSNRTAMALLKSVFNGEKPFSTPKPIELICKMLNTIDSSDSIILDFFAGSATTAHAVLMQNSLDGGNRKFILVQAKEKIEEDSPSFKSGYRYISEIGRERIVRSADIIKSNLSNEVHKLHVQLDKITGGAAFANPQSMSYFLAYADENTKAKVSSILAEYSKAKENLDRLDFGFRVFKCDESNMKDVYFAPKDYEQGFLSKLEDNIKEDRSDLDLLFDCMLRWGVELSLPVSKKNVGECTIHNVNEGDLVACFDGTITDEVIDAIAEMSPLRVVFRDSSFTEASQKMNLFELFKQKCGWSDYEVRNNVKVI